MPHRFFSLSTVVLVALVHIALLCGIDSKQERPCTPNPDDPYDTLECQYSSLQWVSTKTTWHFFNGKYKHYVLFVHLGHYGANMRYEAKGFTTHCHEDGAWCVTHGDPQSPEVAIWYKGYNYQHSARTKPCHEPNGDECSEYVNYITLF
ncbi:hypothetical protein K457DRAFT_20600 [Linnemannia elongata AG-77]|uniref:Uncharacterized protein n=1 Tax=Linnemannia elongata AG-77 TaxID=1314771 RepID=A0A197JU32_9FUNG|nr:hypothetical protein K457DRAFT_20600 [Linnemannia elongata AG-77]